MASEIELQIQEFQELYLILCKDFNQFKKAIERTELSPGQLKILWGFHAYLKRDKKSCLEKLKASNQDHPFFEGVRNCLLGLAHNHFGNYKFALEHLHKSKVFLQETNSDYFKILNNTTLFLAYANRNELGPLRGLIDDIYESHPVNDYSRLSMVMCKALYLQLIGEYNKSNKLINAEFKKHSERFSTFEVSFIIIRFVNYFKNQDYARCDEELVAYKEATGFTSSSNYKFMKLLLDHIVKDAPLYVYKADFEDSSELFDQLMVIKSLAEGDEAQAAKYWQVLARHNGDIYQKDFQYKGGACLFAGALEKQRGRSYQGQLDFSKLHSMASFQDKLKYIIEFGPDTIKKDQLIQWLWKEEPNEKSRARLRKLIFDYHNRHGEALKSYQDTYQKIKKAA